MAAGASPCRNSVSPAASRRRPVLAGSTRLSQNFLSSASSPGTSVADRHMIRIIRPRRRRRYHPLASTGREDGTMLHGTSAACVALGLALTVQSVAAQSDMPAMDAGTHHGAMTAAQAGATPMQPGQDAFGAIQEILQILEADPGTDWSKVNIDALREHLIDMNEVTLQANAAASTVDGGLRIDVTGQG